MEQDLKRGNHLLELQTIPEDYVISDNFFWSQVNKSNRFELSCVKPHAQALWLENKIVPLLTLRVYSTKELILSSLGFFGVPRFSIATMPGIVEDTMQPFRDIYFRTQEILRQNEISVTPQNTSRMLTILQVLASGFAAEIYKEEVRRKVIQLFKKDLPADLILLAIKGRLSVSEAIHFKEVPINYVDAMVSTAGESLNPELSYGKIASASLLTPFKLGSVNV